VHGASEGDARVEIRFAAPPDDHIPILAGVSVDERVVRSLLAEQHPDLAGLPLARAAVGWDNELWRLGDALAVRLPHRELAAPLALKEQRWLPELAPRLPLPIPVPLRTGVASEQYPWPWSVVRWFAGTPADRSPVTHVRDAAGRLGRFLRALHEPAPPDAPHNPFRAVPLADRADAFDERLSALADEVDARAVRAVWDRALAAASAGPPRWAHGDLHPGNVLAYGGTIVAVVDWGDLTAGDPAVDLAAGWALLPLSAIPAFLDAYGGVDEALHLRALGWAVYFGLVLLHISDDDRPTYAAVGHAAIARATSTRR
jgi:aminoglycoside phosphotransferase (APT) family kinase protein